MAVEKSIITVISRGNYLFHYLVNHSTAGLLLSGPGTALLAEHGAY